MLIETLFYSRKDARRKGYFLLFLGGFAALRENVFLKTIRITSKISIDEGDIQEEFVRASGPGGQNVNKVATAVQLRFKVERSTLPQELKERVRQLAGSRLTDEGMLIVSARRFRTQERNRQDVRQRLIALLRDAAKRPRTRKKTKPSPASKQRRLESKRHRSKLKKTRRFDARSEE